MRQSERTASGEPFDAALNLDVVEHVSRLSQLLSTCGRLVRRGCVMVVATINCTMAAFVIAIFGAE